MVQTLMVGLPLTRDGACIPSQRDDANVLWNQPCKALNLTALADKINRIEDAEVFIELPPEPPRVIVLTLNL